MNQLQACADIVARGDPERFQAAMAAPIAARRVLFPLYAFNVEVARAPWVTEEPMIAEMRLQWWRDALEEIAEGREVRKHEVTTPLAEVLDARGAAHLDKLVQARRWDIYREPFEDEVHFGEYLEATGGRLMRAATGSLGDGWPYDDMDTEHEEVELTFGAATALVRFLQAVPELEARGRVPLVDGRKEAIAALARAALERIPSEREMLDMFRPEYQPVFIEGWQTHALLRQIARQPERVAQGRVGLSELRKRWRLFRWA